MPSPPFGSAGGGVAEVGWTTHTVAGATGTLDPNAIASGSGWHMSGSRIQFETTSQGTLRDGWNEGSYLYWTPPADFAVDGTQGMVFDLDDWTIPNDASGLGLGIAVIAQDSPWTIGAGLQAEDQAAGSKRLYEVLPAVRSIEATIVGTTVSSMRLVWMPGVRASALEVGNLTGYMLTPTAVSPGYGYAFFGNLTGLAPRLALVATWNTAVSGRVKTIGARLRSRVIDLAPGEGW
jgi:hypothetical protein